MDKKNVLYIILHVPKTGGTTIREHVKNNLKKEEYIELDISYKKEGFRKANEITHFLSSLNKDERDKIKVIIGHNAYYGVHKNFPNRKYRYLVFVRNPISHCISNNNYLIGLVNSNKNMNKFRYLFYNNRGKLRNLIDNIKKHNFLENVQTQTISGRYFYQVNGNLVLSKKVTKKEFEIANDVLKKCYFIGLTENKEDFLFVYKLLGINKLYLRYNLSNSYYKLKSDDIKDILSFNKYDVALYKKSIKLNRKFKEQNSILFKNINNIKLIVKLRMLLNMVILKINLIYNRIKGIFNKNE